MPGQPNLEISEFVLRSERQIIGDGVGRCYLRGKTERNRFPILLHERYFSTKLPLPKLCPMSDCKYLGVP